MKKATAVAFVIVFAVCMFHYFYAEDHCPIHCPAQGGKFGHVHHHHRDASTCLCYWSSLLGPETDDFARAMDFETLTVLPASGRPCASLGADIAHPPKSSLS